MNRTLGFFSSLVLFTCTVTFAISMAIGAPALSHGASLVLSWSFVLVVCTLATQASADQKAFAYSAVAFSILYAGFAAAVYYAQLTTVLQGTASPDILKTLSFSELGSLMFNYDLLCYAFMAASTFLIGMTISPQSRADMALKAMLLIHGVFAPVCLLLPIFNVFGTMDGSDGDSIGVMVLFAWCIYFAPVGLLAVWHFRPVRWSGTDRAIT